MSVETTKLPDRVERKLTNRNDDCWFEYDGKLLFSDSGIRRIENRFHEMRNSDYEKIATVKGSSTITKTKIRTKDLEDFKHDLTEAHQTWLDNHDEPLTRFGNAMYGEILTQPLTIKEENPRKTILAARYKSGYSIGLGGSENKAQSILLPIRAFEQWSYHQEVVKPLFEKYHEKYPY